jgi:hypothetical protein
MLLIPHWFGDNGVNHSSFLIVVLHGVLQLVQSGIKPAKYVRESLRGILY